MNQFHVWLSRLRTLFTSRKLDEDFDQEVRSHISLLEEENIRRGMSREDAHYAALRSFGAVTQIKESNREHRSWHHLERLLQDVRYAVRLIYKNPGFTTIAVLTLALGIGANTSIFSVVNAVLLRPLPYAHPQELISLRDRQSWPDLKDIQIRSSLLEKLGAFTNWQLDLLGRGEPEQIHAALVSLDLFDVLGVAPELGRTFSGTDDQPGGELVTLVSHGFWERKLGGDPRVIGQTISLSGKSYTVLGVMPPGFRLPEGDAELWVPFRIGYPEAASARGVHFQYTIGRLRSGVILSELQSELDSTAKVLAQLYPDEDRDRRFLAISLQERVVGNVRPVLLILFGAVAFVLLIASLNFANLLLGRATARITEGQVRSALGATPGRLARQFLTESMLISLLGGVAGLVVGVYGVKVLWFLKPKDFPTLATLTVDQSVLLFSLGVSLVTGCLFGLVPILQVILPTSASGLKTGKAVSAQTRSMVKIRRIIIVGEIAVSLMLLFGAGLLIQTLQHLQRVDEGMNMQQVVTAQLWLPQNRYAEIPSQDVFFSHLEDELSHTPGVQSAALVTELPLGGNHIPHDFVIVGRPPRAVGTEPDAETNLISPAYFSTLQIPLLQGRFFNENDRPGTPLVAIVNERMVQEFFPDGRVLGAQLYFARSPVPKPMTIVGVVGNVRESGPDQDADPTIFMPMSQKQEKWRRWSAIVVRSNQNPLTVSPAIKKAVWAVNPQIPVTRISYLTDLLSETLAARRFNTLLLTIFAATAMLLAVIGVYGSVSHTVAQRTQEIGVRMALGASGLGVFWMVLKETLRMTSAGILLGLVGSLGAGRTLVRQLVGVSAMDLSTFALTAILLLGVSVIATSIPARRASRVDPMVALRYE